MLLGIYGWDQVLVPHNRSLETDISSFVLSKNINSVCIHVSPGPKQPHILSFFRWEMGQIKNTSCNWGSGNFAMNYFKTFLFLFFCVVVSKVEKSPLSDKVLMFEKWLLYLSLVHILLIITIFSLENGTLGSKGWKNMEMNHWVGCRLRRLKWKSIWRRKEFLKKICFLSIQSREPSFTGRCFHQVHQDGYSTYKHVLKHDAIGFEKQFVVRQLDTWFQFEKHLLPLNP